jgi:cell fate regulator YaaT (PSP1 superfamily)
MEQYLVAVRPKGTNSLMKYYYYSQKLPIGSDVVIESTIGLQLGKIVYAPYNQDLEKKLTNIGYVNRLASPSDVKRSEDNDVECALAVKYCQLLAERLNLKMKFLSAEYSLDRAKLLLIYVSEERVDFRQLLKELTSIYRSRIELRQIGPRDRAKLVGGVGICGLTLCCENFLQEFEGISINLIKNQMITLNVQKLSGHCTKLICCLKFEDEIYLQSRKEFPELGTRYVHPTGIFTLTNFNLITKICRLDNQENVIFIPLEELKQLRIAH